MILKKAYELTSKQKVNLAHIPTHIKPRYDSEEDYKLQLEKSVRRLSEYQAKFTYYISGYGHGG